MTDMPRIRSSVASVLMCTLIVFPLIGYAELAPKFTLPTDTGTLQLEDLQGKVVYLDFWATWCVPCRKSFPWFNELQARYKDQGLVIVAVSMDKDRRDVVKFLEKYPADFIIAFDPDGDVAAKYNVMGMPSSYLINRHGELHLSHSGFKNKDKAPLESAIQTLLQK